MTSPPRVDQRAGGGASRYLRAVNYLAGAQIYLRDNVLLREPLRPAHGQGPAPRALGHLSRDQPLVYAHFNRLILAHDLDVMVVTGPGHGAPAMGFTPLNGIAMCTRTGAGDPGILMGRRTPLRRRTRTSRRPVHACGC